MDKLHWYQKLDWVNVFYLSATLIGTCIMAPMYFASEGWQWPMIIFFVASCVATNIAITGGYHRFLAHRSYDAKPWVKFIYLLIGAGAFQGSALKWATDHRRHHREVDTHQDPYNINQGFFWAHMGWLMVKDDPKYTATWPPDLARDKMIMFQHKYYLPIAVVVAFGLPTLIGWAMGSAFGGFVLGGGARLVVTNHCTFFINSLCHMVGGRPYTDEVSARDSFIMAILASGEGYHNFHHRFQADYRNGIAWYHFDPTKWLVRSMSWFGWTYSLRRTPSQMVLAARLKMDEKRLVAKGYSQERLAAFRAKVEEAQHRWRSLVEDYKKKKAEMSVTGREYVDLKKAELKVARREFKDAWAQWVAYKRGLIPVPAV